MKCSLGISNFLEEISGLSHSIVFLYFFALIAEEGFFISPCYSLELCIQMGISFLFSFALHFPSECSNYCTIVLISHDSKVMLTILQARLQQYMNFQMFKLVLEKAEEPEIKLQTSAGSSKKQVSSRKTSVSALLTMPKLLTVWITINCGKF